jgi:sialate O-acetylesterase
MRMQRIYLSVVIIAVLLAGVGNAEVRLPAIFSDHAVLHSSEKVPIWGWATPGESVEIRLGSVKGRAVADSDGKWRVDLDLSSKGHGPFDLIVRGSNEIIVSDVLVGVVWVCAGQSNMEMRLNTTGAKEIAAAANNPLLRHFKVERNSAAEPADDVVGKWVLATPAGAGQFSAVGYYFGEVIQRETGHPVGLIDLSWGGSIVEAWTSAEVLAADPKLAACAEEWRIQSTRPEKPMPNQIPSALFNGMLAPILPYSITGAIWYQGESNARPGLTRLYSHLLTAMVRDWRERWESGDFPFYLCQLPNFKAKSNKANQTGAWAELREAQALFLENPNTAMAVLIDVGEEKELHPRNKRDPGERLARIALAKTYGRNIVSSGPVFESAKIEKDKIRLTFSHAEAGLQARQLPETYAPNTQEPDEIVPLVRNSPESEVEGFAICDVNGNWEWAQARIEHPSDVIVWSPLISEPVAVRYAWGENPTCNLFNAAGLPAAPFRTDNFPYLPKPSGSKAASAPES